LKVFVRKDRQGKGIATEASRLIIEHGFKALNLRRVYCGTLDTNEGFKKLSSKLNFVEEGRRKEAVWKDGKFVDVIEYGLLRSDKADDNQSEM
jgi:RimJ/RimL family protein N-acetyltransferase